MKREAVLEALDATGIRREEDFATPINGAKIPLPYMVVRTKETQWGDDAGRVCLRRITWRVALFAANRNKELEEKIRRALAGAGSVKITPYPDGTPYETDFEFGTSQVGE